MDIDYKKYHRDREYLENEKLFKNIFLMRYKMIKKFAPKKGKVLEIGCANGVFLDLYKGAGWKTYGVEPSESGMEAAKKGHQIIRTYFEKAKFPDNYFDLVIMNHTLEHVKDADLILKKIVKILKKGGVLFIDVPNAGGFGSKILAKKWPLLLPKEHTYQFTKESLSKKIEGAGLGVVHFESRSGLFEFADPGTEVWLSLTGFKKRFFTNIIGFPYALVATVFNSGDSMSFIAKK